MSDEEIIKLQSKLIKNLVKIIKTKGYSESSTAPQQGH